MCSAIHFKTQCLGNANNCHGNCDFVARKASKVECLQGIAGACLDSSRISMTPFIFEAMIFSCCNCEFCIEKIIAKALKIVEENRMPAKASGMVAEDDFCNGNP